MSLSSVLLGRDTMAAEAAMQEWEASPTNVGAAAICSRRMNEMTNSTENVFQAALALSPNERAALAEQLLNSLDATEAHIEELWGIEAQQRLEAYRQGKIKAIPAET